MEMAVSGLGDEAMGPDNGVDRRWTLHGTGHMLGLDGRVIVLRSAYCYHVIANRG